MTSISALHEGALAAHLEGLAALLEAAVNDGAAIGFVEPFATTDARRFWTGTVFPSVTAGERVLLVAGDPGSVLGSVQLQLAMPPNQPHRCEVTKLMVHPRARRQGLGRALMQHLEVEARQRSRTLVTLDTRSGDVAEPLYASQGFQEAGRIPGFALDPDRQSLHATTYMYKVL